jgi:hypothetical protein
LEWVWNGFELGLDLGLVQGWVRARVRAGRDRAAWIGAESGSDCRGDAGPFACVERVLTMWRPGERSQACVHCGGDGGNSLQGSSALSLAGSPDCAVVAPRAGVSVCKCSGVRGEGSERQGRGEVSLDSQAWYLASRWSNAGRVPSSTVMLDRFSFGFSIDPVV